MAGRQLSLLERMIVPTETWVKGALFKCHMCGQCVLSHTELICPMNCPKGLRNGPCGGTLGGHCEVYPDRACVWVRVHDRSRSKGNARPVQPPVNRDLVGTSSYLNLLTGEDKPTRVPFAPLRIELKPKQHDFSTGSRLERTLKSGEFALTAEIQSPRSEQGLPRVEREAGTLAHLADGINATSQAGGVASVDSLTTSQIILASGGDPITQVCGRDVNPAHFRARLVESWELGVHTLFCLTGDWYQNRTGEDAARDPWNHYFPMDSSQMLYEARTVRETGKGAVTGARYDQPTPKPFLGGAINPYSEPQSTVFARLAAKLSAGLDFVQTQMILDVPRFQSWVAALQKTGLADRFYLIASVPVILSVRALEVSATLPGVTLPAHVKETLMQGAENGRIDAAGLAWAAETCRTLRETPGVDGIHLMLLGGQWNNLADWVGDLRNELKQNVKTTSAAG